MTQANNAFTTTDGPGVIPATAQFTPVEAAHLDLVARLTRTKLHRLAYGLADVIAFDERLVRVQDVLTAVQAYLDAHRQRRVIGS